MLIEVTYERQLSVDYAMQWALARNPRYLDFEKMGGDCTNFVSQCIFSGCGVMNFTTIYGWYYLNGNNRSASWTGATFLYKFLLANKKEGPYAVEVKKKDVMHGDIVQLIDEKNQIYHSALITGFDSNEILLCAHSIDSYMRPLSSYSFTNVKYIHVVGIRK